MNSVGFSLIPAVYSELTANTVLSAEIMPVVVKHTWISELAVNKHWAGIQHC